MISIAKNIQLQPILTSDVFRLQKLMNEIYPPAYQHFWKDNGHFYVNNQYAEKNILQELSDEKANYYFIILNDEIVGNFRIIWDEKLANLPQEKQVKLHRIYLHQKTQGNGIGKQLLAWLEKKAIANNYKTIWLDAMDAQPQAFQFYKKLGYKYYSHTFLNFELMYDEFRKMSQLVKEI